MRSVQSVVVLAATTVLAGCSSSHGPIAPTASHTPATSTKSGPAEGRRIPDGTYRTVVTRQEELAKHFDPQLVTAMLGHDGRMPVTIKLVGKQWDLFDVLDDGTIDHGDYGTLRYDAHGRLVMTSESSGCSGCAVTYAWTFNGSSLTLTFVSEANSPTSDTSDVQIVTAHTYRKVG